MSANNFILIKETETGNFEISDNDYEGGGKIQDLGTHQSLRGAVEIAETYINNAEIEVEHGIRFNLKSNIVPDGATRLKKFLEWIGLKEKIHNNELLPSFDEREIWWVSLGENVGHEEDGKGNSFERPFVIVRKFNKELLFGVPCSSVTKNNKYYFQISIKSKNLQTSALLSQARVLSSRRLLRMVDKIGSGVFRKLKKALDRALLN